MAPRVSLLDNFRPASESTAESGEDDTMASNKMGRWIICPPGEELALQPWMNPWPRDAACQISSDGWPCAPSNGNGPRAKADPGIQLPGNGFASGAPRPRHVASPAAVPESDPCVPAIAAFGSSAACASLAADFRTRVPRDRRWRPDRVRRVPQRERQAKPKKSHKLQTNVPLWTRSSWPSIPPKIQEVQVKGHATSPRKPLSMFIWIR